MKMILPRLPWLGGSLLLALSACQNPTAGTGGGGASPAPSAAGPGAGASSTPSNPAIAATPIPRKVRGPFSPDAAVMAVSVKVIAKAGGPTMADLDKDTDPDDAFEPKLDVIVQEGDYGKGLDKANAAMGVRGQTTRNTKQKSFRIELVKGAPQWRGEEDLLLNKHPYDLTRVRNKLCFDLLQEVQGLDAPQTRFATLSVDGKDYGLFTHVEKVNKLFLEKRGLPAGPLYKAAQFEFQRQPEVLKLENAPGFDAKAFKKVLEPVGTKDHAKLLAMLEAVNDEKQPINAVIDRHFDRQNYLSWLAFNLLVENTDTNSRNFFLYAPAGSGPWNFIPWDYDGSLGYVNQPNEAAQGSSTPGRWETGPSLYWGVTLHKRFLKEPGNAAALARRVEELAAGPLAPARVKALLDLYKPAPSAALRKAPDADNLPSMAADPVAEFEAEYQRLYGLLAKNLAEVKEAFERPMPVFMDDARQEGGSWNFRWDPSFDLQGDELSYEFRLSKSPKLEAPLVEKKGLKEVELKLDMPLAPGTYYFGVVVRDAKGNWMDCFENLHISDKRYNGVKSFTVK